MIDTDYFLDPRHWSFIGAVIALAAIFSYLIFVRGNTLQKGAFILATVLLYLVMGSPLATLDHFGLDSITMARHMVSLMVVPLLLWTAIPTASFRGPIARWIDRAMAHRNFIFYAWGVGALAMYGGHFLEASLLSAKTGTLICGVPAMPDKWAALIPPNAIFSVLVLAGLFFALPIFHPNKSMRMPHLQRVGYLFTACVSCTVLGVYVAFLASSPAALGASALFTTMRNPIPLTLRTDQQLAGLLMWVPGCLLYVTLSMGIMLEWLKGDTVQQESEGTISISTEP